jgi:hypothetical protein
VVHDNLIRQLEAINKSCEEYQKNVRVITGRIETVCRQTIQQTGEKTQEQGK